MTNIEDLPDFVLVEILCRLPPNNKFSFQCKCVSKRWCRIPDFVNTFEIKAPIIAIEAAGSI